MYKPYKFEFSDQLRNGIIPFGPFYYSKSHMID